MDFRRLDDYKNDVKGPATTANVASQENLSELCGKIEEVKAACGSPESVKVFVQFLASVSDFPEYFFEKSELFNVLMNIMNSPLTVNSGLAAMRHIALHSKPFVLIFVTKRLESPVKSVIDNPHFETRFLGIHLINALVKFNEGSEWAVESGVFAKVLSLIKTQLLPLCVSSYGNELKNVVGTFVVTFEIILSVVYFSKDIRVFLPDIVTVLKFSMECPHTQNLRFRVSMVLTCLLSHGFIDPIVKETKLIQDVVQLLMVETNADNSRLVIQFLAQLVSLNCDDTIELVCTPDVIGRCVEMFYNQIENDSFSEVCLNLFVNFCAIGSDALDVIAQDRKFATALASFTERSNAHLKELAMWLMWTMLYVATIPQADLLLPSFMPLLEESFLMDNTGFLCHAFRSVEMLMRRIVAKALWTKPVYQRFIESVMPNIADLTRSESADVARLATRIVTTYPRSRFV